MYAPRRTAVPIAPDLAIPNSVVWRRMFEWGVRPETVDPSLLRARYASDRRAQVAELVSLPSVLVNWGTAAGDMASLRSAHIPLAGLGLPQTDEEDSDGEQRGNLATLLTNARVAESSDSEMDEEVPTNAERPSRRPQPKPRSFRQLSPRSLRGAKTTADSTLSSRSPSPPFVRPMSSESASPPPSRLFPTRPPLPRFLAQFRTALWFQHHFPLATPKTFDFLRPVQSPEAQVDFSAVVSLLVGDGQHEHAAGLLNAIDTLENRCV